MGARHRDSDVTWVEETGEVVSGLAQLKERKQREEPSRPCREDCVEGGREGLQGMSQKGRGLD